LALRFSCPLADRQPLFIGCTSASGLLTRAASSKPAFAPDPTMPNTLYYDALLSSLFLMSIAFLFLLVCCGQHWVEQCRRGRCDSKALDL
jgi:hypothetical protein